MKVLRRKFDIIVAGAGTAGSAAAYHFAKAGFKVALLDNRAFSKAGALWVNTVIPELFDHAGFDRPCTPELRRNGDSPILIDQIQNQKFEIGELLILYVDMRYLVNRLHNLCKNAGVIFFEHTKAEYFTFKDNRPISLYVTARSDASKSSNSFDLYAKLFVDATGMAGVLRNSVPELAVNCPAVQPKDICDATQFVYEINNRAGACDFYDKFGATPDKTICFIAVEGSYSTLMININKEKTEVSVLTGSIPDGTHKSASLMMKNFLAENKWIGKKIFGGAGYIPIRRPYDRLVSSGIALIGDAGCQVFPAHGSGIGYGMIAGRLLADAVKGAEDCGSLEALWRYQAQYIHKIGSLCASYDIFRRLANNLNAQDMSRLFSAGLMLKSASHAGLLQKIPELDFKELPQIIKGSIKAPHLAYMFAKILTMMSAVYSLYKLYPEKPDLRKLRWWSVAVNKIFKEKKS
jgi:flavin-dependent dehydrogenase